MVKYETLFILRSDVTEDGLDKLKQKFFSIVEDFKGVPLRFENWGKRKLSYEIRNNPKGIYFYFTYISNPGTVEEIHRLMSVNDHILKYQSMKIEEIPDISKVDIEKERQTPSEYSPRFNVSHMDAGDDQDLDDDEDIEDDEDEDEVSDDDSEEEESEEEEE